MIFLWWWEMKRCLQDVNKKIRSNWSYFSIKQKTKNKQNFGKNIFLDYQYFGGLDVTNVLFVFLPYASICPW